MADSSTHEVQLPSEWDEKQLSALVEIRFSSVDKKSTWGELPVRLCNYTDVYSNDYITADMDFMRATATRSEVERFRLAAGDVVVTKDSETPDDIGVPALIDSSAADLLCGYHLAIIKPGPSIDPTFLAKQLTQPRIQRYFGQRANGTTRYGLSAASIQNVPVWLAPIEQQQIIGQIARLVDAAIERTVAMIDKARLIQIGLARQLLTFGIDDNGRVRDPERTPRAFVESPLGQIPREWTVARLVDRISFPKGQVDPRIEPYRTWNLIAPDHIERNTGKLFTRATAADLNAISGKYVVEPDDVVYSKIRPYLCKATLASERCLCSADMYPLRPAMNVSPRYLLAVVLGDAYTRFASAVSMRSGFPKINREEMAQFEMAWPPFDEQKEIGKLLSIAESEQVDLMEELVKLRMIKFGLMEDLLSGCVPVSLPKEAEVAV